MNEDHDDELVVLAESTRMLETLDEAARRRVIEWLADRFGATREDRSIRALVRAQAIDPEDFPALFNEVDPTSERDRVLIAAYWAQEVLGSNPFDAQTVNSLLADLGRPASNITRVLGRLEDETPRLAMRVSKSGRSQQSRKSYRLTPAGLAEVRTIRSQRTQP
jgi:hypothetical protein